MKEANNNAELDALVDAHVEGRLTVEETSRLNSLLEGSEAARRRYWELALVHGLLEQGLQAASVKAAAGEQPVAATVKQGTFLKWPGLAAAAAGHAAGSIIGLLLRQQQRRCPSPLVLGLVVAAVTNQLIRRRPISV